MAQRKIVRLKKPSRALVALGTGASALAIALGYLSYNGMLTGEFFRALANPGVRYVHIAEGMRKEEMADYLAKRLEWDTIEKREFINAHMDLETGDLEGKYFPGSYTFPKDADPVDVSKEMVEAFDKKTEMLEKKYPKTMINYDTAVLIASIIQREAAGKSDMRLISGVIWNRIFRGMSLDMDATIQYARGKTEKGWWAPIKASDIREIESPYNTYKQNGLPPTPISNPGLAAIEAALNPQKTDCLFYIHDKWRRIHCSPTYEGHVRNINAYLK